MKKSFFFTARILAPPGICMDFNSGPQAPFPVSEYWSVPFSSDLSDEALQIGGFFHQGQFSYLSGHV